MVPVGSLSVHPPIERKPAADDLDPTLNDQLWQDLWEKLIHCLEAKAL